MVIRDEMVTAFSHVLWIGGPPDCGKTTVADILAEKYRLQSYHLDQHEMEHIHRSDPNLHPETFKLGKKLEELDELAQLEWLWVNRTPIEMAESAMASWSDRFPLVLEDLLTMPKNGPIIAEGPGFFPEIILPLISNPHQAIWMLPSEAFKRSSHIRRGKGERRAQVLGDPEIAQRNHIERDLLIAERYRRSTCELELPLIVVDGSQSVNEVLAEVEAHFRIYLPPLDSSSK